jgi:response regulator of citrate/malate metabolism
MSHRILVIEDDLALKPMWEAILRRQFVDFHLDWAISCEEARRLTHSSIKFDSGYSFIVADVFLAGAETGLDFLEYKQRILPEVPLILVSAAEEDSIRSNFPALVTGVTVLTKPLSIPQCDRAFEKFFADSVKQAAFKRTG